MDPEVVIGIAAVFVSGGALGVGVTLFGQWVHGKLSWKAYTPQMLESQDVALLRGDVADLNRTVDDLKDRLEFQEKLLAGGSPVRASGASGDPVAPPPDPAP